MTPLQLIQLALALMRLVNWVAGKIDQHEWQKQGYATAMADQIEETKRIVGLVDKAVKDAKAASPTDQQKSLESDL